MGGGRGGLPDTTRWGGGGGGGGGGCCLKLCNRAPTVLQCLMQIDLLPPQSVEDYFKKTVAIVELHSDSS